MKTLHLYIFREILKTFFFALIVFTGVLVLVVVAEKAVMEGIPLTMALSLLPYTIPEQLKITIPVALLLATTTFFARMAGSNEFTALKALGVSPWKVIRPVVIFAFLVSFGYVWFTEVAVPWGQQNITRILVAGFEEIIYSKLRTDHRLAIRGTGIEISIKGVDNRRLLSPTITTKEGKITAQWAEIKIDVPNERGVISIQNANVSNDSTNISFDYHDHPIPLASLIPTSNSQRPSEMSLKNIPGQIEKVQQNKRTVQNQVAARAAFACFGNFEEFTQPVWRESTGRMELHQSMLNKLNLEPQRRFAAGFSCLAFVWIGATLAIWSKKTDIFASFFACFVPILILYYPLLMLGIEWGKEGIAPPVFIWSGNLFIAAIGYWFYKKIYRY